MLGVNAAYHILRIIMYSALITIIKILNQINLIGFGQRFTFWLVNLLILMNAVQMIMELTYFLEESLIYVF